MPLSARRTPTSMQPRKQGCWKSCACRRSGHGARDRPATPELVPAMTLRSPGGPYSMGSSMGRFGNGRRRLVVFAHTKAYSGFAVDDLQKAREFYSETLGLKTSVLDEQNGLMSLH